MAQEWSREWAYDFIKGYLPERVNDLFLETIDSRTSQIIIDRFLSMREVFGERKDSAELRCACLVPVMSDLLRFYDRALDDTTTKAKAMEIFFGVDSPDPSGGSTYLKETEKRKMREKFTLISCAG